MALAIFEVMRALEALSPKQMGASHRLVLLVLADHARDSDRAWPSLSRLAAMTGLARSTVVTCLNELEAAGWIERQGSAPAGPGGRASTMYLVRSSGGSVARAPSPPAEAAMTSPTAGLVRLPDQSDSRTSPITGRQGSDYRTSGVRLPDVRGPVIGHKALRESPIEAPREDHPPAGGCAPAGAARGEGPEVGSAATCPEPASNADAAPASARRSAVACAPPPAEPPRPAAATSLFPGFEAVAAPPPPAKAARRRAAAPKTPEPDDGVSKSLRRYADAYARGQTASGCDRFVPPTDSHAKYIFQKALPVYAVDADGQRLEGEALDAWIEASSAEYRRATGSQPQYQGGFHPRKWAEWLGAGKPRTGVGGRRAPQFQGGRIDEADLAAQQRKRSAELDSFFEQDAV